MSALWVLIGGIGGLLRMLAAGALVALVGFFYVTVWSLPAARDEARQGYVVETRALTAEALVAKLQKEATAFQTVIDAYQIQYKNALALNASQDAETEKAIETNDKLRSALGRKCPALNSDDLLFLQQ